MIKNLALLGIFFFATALLLTSSCSIQKESKIRKSNAHAVRIVGYLLADNSDKIEMIQFDKLTHLNIAFANPDQKGNILFKGDIDQIVSYAKKQNPTIIISISIAGGVIPKEIAQNWAYLIDHAENRPTLIRNLISFVKQHELDGIDVDLEWDDVPVGYSDFIIELNEELKPLNLLLTCALPNDTRFKSITDAALNTFDFINIMSYDYTGPWDPLKKGQHSSYENAVSGIYFWNTLQKVPAQKLNLGVPFYGYNFESNVVTSSTFGEIIKKDKNYGNFDSFGATYYNGSKTIRKKVVLAAQQTGGIMIWEISQDSFGQNSLLNTISEEFNALGYKISND